MVTEIGVCAARNTVRVLKRRSCDDQIRETRHRGCAHSTVRMRTLARIVFALGLIVVVALVEHEGAQSIAELFKRAGWVLLLLAPLHAIPLLLDVIG